MSIVCLLNPFLLHLPLGLAVAIIPGLCPPYVLHQVLNWNERGQPENAFIEGLQVFGFDKVSLLIYFFFKHKLYIPLTLSVAVGA